MATGNGNGNGSMFPQARADFWMRVASLCFGLWALAIPIGVEILRVSLRDIQAEIHLQTGKATEYRLATERRIVVLEERLATFERELVARSRQGAPR
jgi:hypothetical protein